MIRILLINLLLFLLPFIVYALWRWFIKGERSGRQMADDAPVFILLSVGLVLVAGGLFTLASSEVGDIEKRYVPPAYVDGEIRPGHYEER